VVRYAKLITRVHASPLPTKPFAVEQMGAPQLKPHAGPAEPFDALAAEPLGNVVLAQQGARAGVDPECPLRSAGTCRSREQLEVTDRLGGEPGLWERLWSIAAQPDSPVAGLVQGRASICSTLT
jgi:hypothetical protein